MFPGYGRYKVIPQMSTTSFQSLQLRSELQCMILCERNSDCVAATYIQDICSVFNSSLSLQPGKGLYMRGSIKMWPKVIIFTLYNLFRVGRETCHPSNWPKWFQILHGTRSSSLWIKPYLTCDVCHFYVGTLHYL